jgi:acetyl-CoA acyltransferase
MKSSRIAVLDGTRTPFGRVNGGLKEHSAVALGTAVVDELLDSAQLEAVDQERMYIAWGSSLAYPNELYGGREIALRLGLNKVDGHDTEYACASSVKTVHEAALLLGEGYKDVVIAGGGESLSNQPVAQSEGARQLARSNSIPDNPDLVSAMLGLTLKDLLPQPQKFSEPITGETMAFYAAQLMDQWGVRRNEADAYAVNSHVKASACRSRLNKRITPMATENGLVQEDEYIRDDSTLEKVSALTEVDVRAPGITAANASPLTDGAGGVVLSTEEWALANGYEPLGYIRATALRGHDPDTGVLLGPAFTIPLVLERAGLSLHDIEVIDLHEAFAGQVLANLNALSSRTFAEKHLGRSQAVGEINPQEINAWGGSISIGHPFGATGARLILQVLDQLEERNAQYGLFALCVGGSRGAAMVLERE